MIDWSKYDDCHKCDAVAGAQCEDMRYARSWGSHKFYVDRPHAHRPKK